ncbi:MAG TPA: diaminopimelate epimerase [Thermoanaerobaculia bacterium]|nr:diaminopimelate epimerase [Thermoanaerobaculia bacterium]
MTRETTPSPFGALPCAFTKMSGAGNDFLVFGARVERGPREIEAIRRLCRRGTGVGADGVLFVFAEREGDPSSRIVVDYVNADGSVGRFCGNGTRCAARFAVRNGLAGASLVAATGWGAIGATVRSDGTVELALPEPVAVGRAVPSLDTAGETLEKGAFALVVGVPHVVSYVQADVDLDALDLSILGPLHRRHPAMREGANANFVKVLSPSRIAVRTWERGVEAETLACGSGAVAAAVVTSFLKGANPPVSVATRSGETLEVSFLRDGEVARDVTLTGDARFVFEGTLVEEP